MRQPFLRSFLGISVLLISGAAGAQSSGDNAANKSIQGTVRASGTQQGLERARVDLTTVDQQLIYTSYTDSNGRFEFRNLARGMYRIQMSAEGYEPLEKSVDLRFGPTRAVDYSLEPIRILGSTPGNNTVSAHELSLSQNARDAMEAGKNKLYGKKDPQGSLADFAHAIAAAPNYYEAHYEMGVAHWQLGNIAEAEQDLRRSIELSADKFTKAELALGALLLDRGQFAGAEKPFRRAAELEPNNWLTQYELSRALLGQQRLAEALQYAEIARVGKPDSPRVFLLLASIHSAQKNQTAALDDLNAYLKLDPDSLTALRVKKMKENVARSLAQGQPASAAQTVPKP